MALRPVLKLRSVESVGPPHRRAVSFLPVLKHRKSFFQTRLASESRVNSAGSKTDAFGFGPRPGASPLNRPKKNRLRASTTLRISASYKSPRASIPASAAVSHPGGRCRIGRAPKSGRNNESIAFVEEPCRFGLFRNLASEGLCGSVVGEPRHFDWFRNQYGDFRPMTWRFILEPPEKNGLRASTTLRISASYKSPRASIPASAAVLDHILARRGAGGRRNGQIAFRPIFPRSGHATGVSSGRQPRPFLAAG